MFFISAHCHISLFVYFLIPTSIIKLYSKKEYLALFFSCKEVESRTMTKYLNIVLFC